MWARRELLRRSDWEASARKLSDDEKDFFFGIQPPDELSPGSISLGPCQQLTDSGTASREPGTGTLRCIGLSKQHGPCSTRHDIEILKGSMVDGQNLGYRLLPRET